MQKNNSWTATSRWIKKEPIFGFPSNCCYTWQTEQNRGLFEIMLTLISQAERRWRDQALYITNHHMKAIFTAESAIRIQRVRFAVFVNTNKSLGESADQSWPCGRSGLENPVSAWTSEMSLSSHKTAAYRTAFHWASAPEHWWQERWGPAAI